MSDSLEAGLVIRALQQALATRGAPPGLIHHSDRGVQYACKEFRKLLGENSIEQSMSAKGNCYENATMESFFGTLKAEETGRYPDWSGARLAIFDYLEGYYNRTRIHTSLESCTSRPWAGAGSWIPTSRPNVLTNSPPCRARSFPFITSFARPVISLGDTFRGSVHPLSSPPSGWPCKGEIASASS